MKEKALAGEKTSFTEFSEGHSSIVPTILVWITFLLVAGFVVYGWLNSRMQEGLVSDLGTELASIQSNLESGEWSDVKNQVLSMNLAIDSLVSAKDGFEKKSELLDDVYQYFTTDIYIKDLSLTGNKELSVSGNTKTYRQVADLMAALKSSERISKVSASNLSTTDSSDDQQNPVSFVLTAEMQPKEKTLSEPDLSADTMETLSPQEAF